MAKKDKGHVKEHSIIVKTTEAFMCRGYSEEAFECPLETKESDDVFDVGGEKDSKPQSELEVKRPQIEKPSLFMYKSGGMKI